MKFSFPEQRAKWDDSGFMNLEPCDLWAERYGCFNGGADNNGGGGGSDNEPRGTVFGVDGRSVTGSTAQDKAIGWSDGSGGAGANYDALSEASSSDVQAAVDAANEAARSGGNTVQAAAGVVGGAGLDAYGIGSGGEFSTSARAPAGAPAASAALAGLTDSPVDQSFNVSPPASRSQNLTREQQAIVETARARGETPPDFDKPMTVAEIAREEQLADIFSEIGLDPAAGQEQERARQAAGQEFLDNFLGVTRSDTGTAANVLGTPMDANEFAGSGIRSLPDTVYDSDMGMVGSRTSVPTGELYGGYEDDPAYDADLFGTPRYAGGITGLDGRLQGFDMTGYTGRSDQPRDPNVSSMGGFADSATEGGLLAKVADFGIIPSVVSAISGKTPLEMRRDAVQEFFESGAQFNSESGKMELPAGKGMLKMSDTGVVTYSGQPDPNYTGMYSNLINPPPSSDNDSAINLQEGPIADPCPEGYKMVDGACQPVDDVTDDGTSINLGPGSGATSFQPFTQATQVGGINPFVLQPYSGVSPFRAGGYVDTSSLAGLAEASGYDTSAGQSISSAMDARNEPDDGPPMDTNFQSVMAQPVQQNQPVPQPSPVVPQQTQSVMAQPTTAPVVPQQQQQQQVMAMPQQAAPAVVPQNQPGLAKTIYEGALDIFSDITGPSQETLDMAAQSRQMLNQYTNVPANLQSYAPQYAGQQGQGFQGISLEQAQPSSFDLMGGIKSILGGVGDALGDINLRSSAGQMRGLEGQSNRPFQ